MEVANQSSAAWWVIIVLVVLFVLPDLAPLIERMWARRSPVAWQRYLLAQANKPRGRRR